MVTDRTVSSFRPLLAEIRGLLRIEFQITHAILEINSDECVVVTGDASILFDAGLVTEKCPLLTMKEALEPENMLLS